MGEFDEDASEEGLQDDLQFDHASFSEFEVVGNVNTPQPFVEPTPKSAPRPPMSQEPRVAVGGLGIGRYRGHLEDMVGKKLDKTHRRVWGGSGPKMCFVLFSRW